MIQGGDCKCAFETILHQANIGFVFQLPEVMELEVNIRDFLTFLLG